MSRRGLLVLMAVLATFAAACGGGAADEGAGEEGEHGEEHEVRTIEAPAATIAVDGDTADWADIAGLEVTLEAIQGQEVEPRAASVKVAHDDQYVYVLFEVNDDYNWDAEDAHLSGSSALMWAIDEGAGEHMGAEEPARNVSLGMVDIWHWELDCPLGEQSGGAVHDPGDGDPGNDGGCNFDDEWATIPDEREDDVGEGAENSLLGVWNHTDATEGAQGTWIFEMQRPLETGDPQDAQFSVGGSSLMAIAYWDPDNSPEGWDEKQHVQSSNQGWIEVTLA